MFDRILNALLLTGRYKTPSPTADESSNCIYLSVLRSKLIVSVWLDVSANEFSGYKVCPRTAKTVKKYHYNTNFLPK